MHKYYQFTIELTDQKILAVSTTQGPYCMSNDTRSEQGLHLRYLKRGSVYQKFRLHLRIAVESLQNWGSASAIRASEYLVIDDCLTCHRLSLWKYISARVLWPLIYTGLRIILRMTVQLRYVTSHTE